VFNMPIPLLLANRLIHTTVTIGKFVFNLPIRRTSFVPQRTS